MAETPSVFPLDYTTRDYAAFKADLSALAALLLPEWTGQSEADFGMVLLELFAYVGDVCSYYIDREMSEAFLPTAQLRSSVFAIAALLDYSPAPMSPAVGSVTFTSTAATTVPAGTQVSTIPSIGNAGVVFETNVDTVIGGAATTAIAVTQGVTHDNEAVGVSDGTVGQGFSLYNAGVIANSVNVFVDEGGGPVIWPIVQSLVLSGPLDRAVSLNIDENAVASITFGDDTHGRIPRFGAVITVTYRTGNGASGNVGIGAVTMLVAPVSHITTITNAAPMTGGVDSESVASMRSSIPESVVTLKRAVCAADFEILATQVSGVLKAQALANVYTNVSLYIVPVGGGMAASSLLTAVETYLADKVLFNVDVTALAATTHNIDVAATVNVLSTFSQAQVKNDVTAALNSYFAIENVDFAQVVSVSDIYRVIGSVEGVASATLTTLANHGSGGVASITAANGDVPALQTLTLTMAGGV